MSASHGLRIHHIEPFSRSNGPGWRTVLWVQGCTLGCPGCFNPQTHPRSDGLWMTIDQIYREIIAHRAAIEGVTVSGGEPLQQMPGLIELLKSIRSETDLSILLFSGFSWLEIQKMPRARELLPLLDVLIAGRYQVNLRVASGLLGSSNKTIHFLSTRYHQADLDAVPEAEVILNSNGEIIFSGINPIQWTE